MATEDFYTFSEKLLRKNPEVWYGLAAVLGWLLLAWLYRLLRAEKLDRQEMLRSCGGMGVFLFLFALAAFGFAAAFTSFSGQ